MKTAWSKVRAAANVDCRLHDLRHTARTKTAETGVPKSLLAIMGHTSSAMLERYRPEGLSTNSTALGANSTIQ